MSERWTYGNYQFAINPNSQSTQYELVGDIVNTLTGVNISQPTFLKKAYEIQSVFYQPRSRAISDMSLQGNDIKFYNNNFYVLNKSSDTIDVYLPNLMVKSSTISLSALTNKNYVGLDVQSDGLWIASYDATNEVYYKIGFNGTLIQTHSITRGSNLVGVRVMNGYLWSLRSGGTISKIRLTDFALVSTLILPSGISYSGLSSIDNYLTVGNNDGGVNTIFHVNSDTSLIVNSFITDRQIDSVETASGYFYTINKTTNTITKLFGNTVDVDIDMLIKEIAYSRFVTMKDDMGVETRVYVSDFTKRQKIGYDNAYDVSLNVTKVNRG